MASTANDNYTTFLLVPYAFLAKLGIYICRGVTRRTLARIRQIPAPYPVHLIMFNVHCSLIASSRV